MEGTFRNNDKRLHLYDFPMFSIFLDGAVDTKLFSPFLHKNKKEMQDIFLQAEKEIRLMGFPSMHANTVLSNLDPNVLGNAYGSTRAPKGERRQRFMNLSLKLVLESLVDDSHKKYLIETIVHEWSHLWMFNHGKNFYKAVEEYHEALTQSNMGNYINNNFKNKEMVEDIYKGMLVIQKNLMRRPTVNRQQVGFAVYELIRDQVGRYYRSNSNLISNDEIIMLAKQLGRVLLDSDPQELRSEFDKYNVANSLDEFIEYKLNLDIPNNRNIRNDLNDLVKFTGEYGLTNPDEVWATAIQKFKVLEPYHKKRILSLMQSREPRELPNRRAVKYKNSLN